jgi:hypothetical protein
MKNKSAKKLRKLAEHLTVGKTKSETKKVYKRLKSVHKTNKKEL